VYQRKKAELGINHIQIHNNIVSNKFVNVYGKVTVIKPLDKITLFDKVFKHI